MRKFIAALALSALALGGATAVQAKQTGDEKLAKLLDGRVAGQPKSCIYTGRTDGMQVIEKVNGESFRKAVAPAYQQYAKEFGADRIAARLERQGIDAVALQSDRTQSQRMRALEGFKQGRFRVMVAGLLLVAGLVLAAQSLRGAV